jgi:hypothetical protein
MVDTIVSVQQGNIHNVITWLLEFILLRLGFLSELRLPGHTAVVGIWEAGSYVHGSRILYLLADG